MFEEMQGENVEIRELTYFMAIRDHGPSEIVYRGTLKAIEGHMILLDPCRIESQNLNRPHPQRMWFNTTASSFQSIQPI